MSYFNQVSLYDNQTARTSRITPDGFIIVGDIIRLGGGPFTGSSLDTFKQTLTVTGTGAGTVGGGIIALTTGTTANSTVSLQSTKVQRYITGNDTRAITMAAFGDTGTANNTRRIGIYSATDGFFFQLSGTTFSVVTRKSSVDTVINSGSFNGPNVNSYTVNTNYHRYEIIYAANRVYFIIDDIVIHFIEFTSSPITTTLQFPWQIENFNSGGGTSNVTLNVRGWVAQSIGATTLVPDFYCLNGVTETRTLKTGGGRLQKALVTSTGAGHQTVTIYDSLTGSGLVIGVIDATTAPVELEFNVNFVNGLTYVSGLTTGVITFTWE